jgi:hypothetical protein
MSCYAMPCTVTLGDVRVCMYVRHKAGEKTRASSKELLTCHIVLPAMVHDRNRHLKLVSNTGRGSSFEDPAARVDEVGSRPWFPRLFFSFTSHGERATCQKARSICRCSGAQSLSPPTWPKFSAIVEVACGTSATVSSFLSDITVHMM